jgi:hypothetical protein
VHHELSHPTLCSLKKNSTKQYVNTHVFVLYRPNLAPTQEPDLVNQKLDGQGKEESHTGSSILLVMLFNALHIA